MYDAAVALRGAMIELGLACDGGKDSLSMAASAGGEVSLHLTALPCSSVYLLGMPPSAIGGRSLSVVPKTRAGAALQCTYKGQQCGTY